MLKRKQEISLQDFCRNFYEKNILKAAIEGLDFTASFTEGIRQTIVEVDNNFASIDSNKFAAEVVILRFELFSLAWIHQFGDKLAVAQSSFTKQYLHENRRDDIWDDSESYNHAIARSSIVGKTSKKPPGGEYLACVNLTKANLFEQFYNEGCEPGCVARALNRLFTDEPWKKGITQGLLMFALCDRLGFGPNFEPNTEAQFRLTAIIRGLYDGARRSLNNIQIKN